MVGYQPLAELQVLVSVSSADPLSALVMKSCQPSKVPNMYDTEYTNIGGDYIISLSLNCHEISGGIWFFTFQCNSNEACIFTVQSIGMYHKSAPVGQ